MEMDPDRYATPIRLSSLGLIFCCCRKIHEFQEFPSTGGWILAQAMNFCALATKLRWERQLLQELE